jgi:ribosomal protein S18 acetylase RimI-like enzyme
VEQQLVGVGVSGCRNPSPTGVGSQLMEQLAEKGKAAGLRIIVCETQTTNVPAIQFYHRVGFVMEGIDLSYYSNEDYSDGEIAVFMKRRLT